MGERENLWSRGKEGKKVDRRRKTGKKPLTKGWVGRNEMERNTSRSNRASAIT